jgi:hypothetical protein
MNHGTRGRCTWDSANAIKKRVVATPSVDAALQLANQAKEKKPIFLFAPANATGDKSEFVAEGGAALAAFVFTLVEVCLASRHPYFSAYSTYVAS